MKERREFIASCDRVESGVCGRIAVLISDDDEREYRLKLSAGETISEGGIYLCLYDGESVSLIKRLTELEEKRKKEAIELFEHLTKHKKD